MKTRCTLALVSLLLLPFAASAQSLPSGWNSLDIGAVGAAGSATYGGGTFTMAGAGADIWGNADAFRFAYTTMTGDGTVVARIASEQAVSNWTKAGVMIRETLDPGSRHALMLVSPGKGTGFQRRLDPNGLSTHTPGIFVAAPYYVKLTRTGTTISGFTSPDGSSWSLVGTDTIAMSSTVYVGLALTSHVAGTLASATFTATAVTPAASTSGTETLVFFRHGEKPSGGYGQLTCQGLNRALALPSVLVSRYGSAQYAFAPNPTVAVPDPAGSFYYVRPIATIEPTTIRLGLPLNTKYGYTDIAGMQAELTGGSYPTSTVFIAWEHEYLQQMVQNILNAYGAGVTVPAWSGTDYDSIYVVRITTAGGTTTAHFTHDFEGLNGLSTACQ